MTSEVQEISETYKHLIHTNQYYRLQYIYIVSILVFIQNIKVKQKINKWILYTCKHKYIVFIDNKGPTMSTEITYYL